MPPPYRHGISVTVHRPGGVDVYGDPDPGTPPTSHVVAGCALAPRTSSEDRELRGETVIVGQTLYAPFDADIGPADKIELPGGVRYEVVGEPGRWLNPHSGRAVGMSVALQRATG